MGPNRGISINKEQPQMQNRTTTGVTDRKKTREVLEGFIERGKVSISDAQRYHKLGYNRAKAIMSTLVDLGFIYSHNVVINTVSHGKVNSKGYSLRKGHDVKMFNDITYEYKQQKRPRLR